MNYKKISEGLRLFAALSCSFLLLIILLRFFEIILNKLTHSFSANLLKVFGFALLNDLLFWCKISGWLLLIFLPVYLFNKKAGRIVYIVLAVAMLLLHTALLKYFTSSLVPLGADLFGYTLNDIKQTVGASGALTSSIIAFVLLLAVVAFVFLVVTKKLPMNNKAAYILSVTFLFVLVFNPVSNGTKPSLGSEYLNDLTINKTNFFLVQSCQHLFPVKYEVDIYADNYLILSGEANDSLEIINYVDEQNFPFLHIDNTPDVLSAFMNKSSTRPNVVIILVEGLGRAFSNEGAYLGSFTPFLDSLSQKSLYWENFLSQGGRTFAVLPSLLGSLPFGENGFADMGEKMPPHLSLISLLKYNQYHTSFYYGGDAKFDNMNTFLNRNKIDGINDLKTFPSTYVKMPSKENGFTWGYGDKELFRRYFDVKNGYSNMPFLDVLLTVSTHTPFLINDQEKYLRKFQQRMDELGFDESLKASHISDQSQYASIMYADDALNEFFSAYSKRDDFKNTIFIITGDHRMPEIAMSSKIDRYHVPLIIYSPLLKRTAKFSSISTHFDIAPTLLAYMKANYNIQVPSLVSWLGTGIDTTRDLQNKHAYPLMQTKTDMVDFVMHDHQFNNGNLFNLGQNLNAAPVNNPAMLNELQASFDQFKRRNNKIVNGGKLVPDSIYNKYFPR